MHKNATKCNETICKWCKNKHGASKIIDTFETYQGFERSRNMINLNRSSLGKRRMRNKGLVALHKSKSQNRQTSSNKGKEGK
jgi:hypothetical protein